jgi:fermentation-respiration switch protein FrsA (DUF1100 family)
MFLEYEPGAHIAHISPTPLMMVVALGDHLTVADEALAAYERALEPKRLVMLPGGHFDAYVRDFAASSGAACQWFRERFAHHRLTLGALHCHCPFLDQRIRSQSNGGDKMTLPPGRFD